MGLLRAVTGFGPNSHTLGRFLQVHRTKACPGRRRQIRVSFDLDDTLTCHCSRVPTETGMFPGFVYRWFGEPLRRGTAALIRELRGSNCSIWINTSSGRSPLHIRRWLLLHGIRVVVVEPHGKAWTERVLDAVARLRHA